MKTLKDELIEARKRIELPENWLKGTLQEYNQDNVAIRFCAFGACSNEDVADALIPHLAPHKCVKNNVRMCTEVCYNDAPDVTHEDILALFDRAIAAQE